MRIICILHLNFERYLTVRNLGEIMLEKNKIFMLDKAVWSNVLYILRRRKYGADKTRRGSRAAKGGRL